MRASQSAKDQQKFLLGLSEEECPKHHSDLHYHSKIIAIIRVLNEKQLVVSKFSSQKARIPSQITMIFRTITFGRIENKLGNVNPSAES